MTGELIQVTPICGSVTVTVVVQKGASTSGECVHITCLMPCCPYDASNSDKCCLAQKFQGCLSLLSLVPESRQSGLQKVKQGCHLQHFRNPCDAMSAKALLELLPAVWLLCHRHAAGLGSMKTLGHIIFRPDSEKTWDVANCRSAIAWNARRLIGHSFASLRRTSDDRRTFRLLCR